MPKGIYQHKPHSEAIKLAHQRKSFGFQKGHKINLNRFVSLETRKKNGERHKGLFVGEKSVLWKGDKAMFKSHNRWFLKRIGHPLANSQGYVRRARLVIEKYLNRYLTPKEVVHHINNIKSDDRLENLILFPNQAEHLKFHK